MDNIRGHIFTTASQAEDAIQWKPGIKDGDVIICSSQPIIGVIYDGRPIGVTSRIDDFEVAWIDFWTHTPELHKSLQLAVKYAKRLNYDIDSEAARTVANLAN